MGQEWAGNGAGMGRGMDQEWARTMKGQERAENGMHKG